jgi:hypothetical protein
MLVKIDQIPSTSVQVAEVPNSCHIEGGGCIQGFAGIDLGCLLMAPALSSQPPGHGIP